MPAKQAESREDILRRHLDRQKWTCVECAEDIESGEKITRDGERGFVHVECASAYIAPERP